MGEADPTAVAWRLAAGLARSRTEGEAAAEVAAAAALLTGAEQVRVWMFDHTEGYRFSGAWPETVKRPRSLPKEVPRALALGPVAAPAERLHRSRLVVPLSSGPRPIGAVELLEGERPAGPFTVDDAAGLSVLIEAAGAALVGIRISRDREEQNAAALTRLSRLFDVSRTLATTVEMSELGNVIVERVRSSLEVQAAYLWLLDEDGERLAVTASAGGIEGAVEGWELPVGEGLAGSVAASSEPALTEDPDEIEALGDRPDREGGLEIRGLAAAPVLSDEQVLGVIEVVNREDEEDSLEDEDLAFLAEAGRTAGAALENARRLDAERRASDLGNLLAVAQEISASLDRAKIAYTLVHRAATVIQYGRAAVGLLRGAGLEIMAISGQTFVDETLPDVKALREVMTWASGLEEGIYVVQEEDGTIDAQRPETRERFAAYFQAAGSRSFLVVPLKDDEGRLGVFTLEAEEPYAFGERDLEAAGLLGAQAAAAIRNAVLYQQIPMVRLFRPWVRLRDRFLGLDWGRRAAWIGGILIAVVLLVVVPFPLRISGDARVLPVLRLPATAEVAGRVREVHVREGDVVQAGQVLAVLDDTDYQIGAEEVRARYEVALREQTRLRAEGFTADATVEAARAGGLRAELDLWEERIAATRIRAPAGGIVATPRVDERIGTRLDRGDLFCEVVEPRLQRVELAVAEHDAGLLAEDQPVKVKLNAFPTDSFAARIEQVGVAAAIVEEERVFLARARLEEGAPPLRSGMTGRAKVTAGRASALRILTRRPARWLWGVIWGWLP